MQRTLTVIAYALLSIAALALLTLLIVFPLLGTEGGGYTLYAMRRPVAVTRGEYRFVMGLFAAWVLGSVGGVALLVARSSLRK